MKTIIYDSETSNLNADFGHLLCAVGMDYNSGEIFKLRIDDYPGWEKRRYDDKYLVKSIVELLSQYDIIVTYNGRNFDLPFLRSQVVAYDLPKLKDMFHIDVYYLTKYKLRLHNNKLNTLIQFLNTYRSGKKRIEEKTAINALYYKQAITGNKKGLDELVKHCVKDVLALSRCYDYLKNEVRSLSKSYL